MHSQTNQILPIPSAPPDMGNNMSPPMPKTVWIYMKIHIDFGHRLGKTITNSYKFVWIVIVLPNRIFKINKYKKIITK